MYVETLGGQGEVGGLSVIIYLCSIFVLVFVFLSYLYIHIMYIHIIYSRTPMGCTFYVNKLNLESRIYFKLDRHDCLSFSKDC